MRAYLKFSALSPCKILDHLIRWDTEPYTVVLLVIPSQKRAEKGHFNNAFNVQKNHKKRKEIHMNGAMSMLQEGLQDIFPEIDGMEILPETQLFEIPEWDSMSSVNLQVFLESSFNVMVNQNLLNDETTIAEILNLVQAKAA